MLKRVGSWVLGVSMLSIEGPVSAEALATIWTLEPTVKELPLSATYGRPFFEQTLYPIRMAKIRGSGSGSANSGALLYVVFTPDGRTAYCTFKDRSVKNQASSLFIPALDKRPCYVDADGDGQFESTFSVFDKFGSMLTPSGNISDAIRLPSPVGYEQVDPHLAPQTMRIAFELAGSKRPDRARINVKFDKAGRNRWEYLVGDMPRRGATILVVNAEITVKSVLGKEATIGVTVDPNIVVTGSSGGTLTTRSRPVFLR